MDGLYNVYALGLGDPTEERAITLLSSPVPATTSGVGRAAHATAAAAAKQRPAEAAVLPLEATVEVPLNPMRESQQQELKAFMKDLGVRVTVNDPLTASGSTAGSLAMSASTGKNVPPTVHFPRDRAAAAKLKVRMQTVARELDDFIGGLSLADVTAIQRDVAESGDGLFHPVVAYAMHIKKALSNSALAALMQM